MDQSNQGKVKPLFSNFPYFFSLFLLRNGFDVVASDKGKREIFPNTPFVRRPTVVAEQNFPGNVRRILITAGAIGLS